MWRGWSWEQEEDEICQIPYDEGRTVWCYTVTRFDALIHSPSGDKWIKTCSVLKKKVGGEKR